jgi:anti-anti-sigma regulatory factor
MTLKIETISDGTTTTLRLVGRIESEYLTELAAQLRRYGQRLVLDLEQVTLVDIDVVRFLIAREAEGIELRNRAPYIREWMDRERHAD